MEQAKPREAGDRARRRLVLTLLVTGGALFVATIVLASLNHTFTDDPFTLELIVTSAPGDGTAVAGSIPVEAVRP